MSKEIRGQVVAIAHRLSTIKAYDQICVLESGQIAPRPPKGLGFRVSGLGFTGCCSTPWRFRVLKT